MFIYYVGEFYFVIISFYFEKETSCPTFSIIQLIEINCFYIDNRYYKCNEVMKIIITLHFYLFIIKLAETYKFTVFKIKIVVLKYSVLSITNIKKTCKWYRDLS